MANTASGTGFGSLVARTAKRLGVALIPFAALVSAPPIIVLEDAVIYLDDDDKLASFRRVCIGLAFVELRRVGAPLDDDAVYDRAEELAS